MSNNNKQVSRRSLLKGLAAIPVVAVVGYQGKANAAMLSVNDPTAKALGYVEKSTVAGQNCINCNLYQGGTAAAGGCPIFPGKDVAGAGWCKSWVKKA